MSLRFQRLLIILISLILITAAIILILYNTKENISYIYMEYLKAFTIGSSGLVLFPFLSSISRDKRFEFKKHLYLILPFYYGFMSMLVIFIKKT